jgi:uncharacterized repeat protein (TIGR03806 family)
MRSVAKRAGGAVGAVAVVVGLIAACGGGDSAGAPQAAADDAGALDSPVVPVATDAGIVRAEFGLDSRPSNPTCHASARPPVASTVQFQRVYAGVDAQNMTAIAQPPGDPSRWFAILLQGLIVSISTVTPPVGKPPIVADLGALAGMPVRQVGEGGLLGIAIHPKFAQNGQIFVSWTTTSITGGPDDLRSVVSRLTSDDNGQTFTKYETILGPFEQPANNHNGGGAHFGPDGFLYLSFGDGGGGGDPYNNGQSLNGFFSKILRIDVDTPPPPGKTYVIPDGNPFKAGGGEPATFARGFRNPFRFNFDRGSGDLWVGDVGQGAWEEIDVVKAGGNYGWPCREGAHVFPLGPPDPAFCATVTGLTDPVFEIFHDPVTSPRRSLTGGLVYRGKAIPSMVGSYFFGDFVTNELTALAFDPTTGAPKTTNIEYTGAGPIPGYWLDFAEDQDGELYAANFSGEIYKMVATGAQPVSTFPDRLSKTGCVETTDPKRPAPGVIRYDVNAPFWSDGASKDRYLAIPDGTTIKVEADGDFTFPTGSVLMKTFSIGAKRIETRLFMRHDDGGWAGYSYEWLDDQSDAVLLPSSKRKTVGAQQWSFPSRADCIRCHTEAAGRTLGPELGQLNKDLVYESTNRISNQLATLDHVQMFTAPLGKPVSMLPSIPSPTGTDPLQQRVRAYLHANCSNCHRPNGGGAGQMDLRFTTPSADMQACNVAAVTGDLGVTGAKLIVPGSSTSSLISIRPRSQGVNRMPPLGSSVVDETGLAVVDTWLNGLTTCP